MNKNTKVVLAILLGNLFIAFLGIGLIIPVLPTIMNELQISGTVVGYLTAAFALTSLVLSPIAGRFADKYGRKIMIILGLATFAVSELLFGLGKTVEVLFISRILGGVSGAFIMPAVMAYIADITTMETRPKALGYMSAAISTGFIIGPGVGGFLAEIGTRVPFFAAAVLGVVATVLSILFLTEPERTEQPEVVEHAKSKSPLKKILIPMFLIAFLILFISSFGLAVVESFISLYTDHKFGFEPRDIAIVITVSALIGALSQVLLFDRMTQWWGEIKLIRLCLVISAIFVFAITQVSSYLMIIFVITMCFVGFDLIRPAATSYLSKIAGNDQGFVGGMNSMFTSLANAIGPILGGMLFDIDVDYPYYLATVFLAVALGIALVWKKPVLKQPAETVSATK
ncbi:MFS transporter [Ureibacillus chungkukjangi]|uniref:DHA1 family multidrug resistance protein-like MFS transporter n=1 Tax=Ureibacillus chungkukjangi TaxID=1202712 RepID=A0A318TKL1_9BACL|nr:MFS transporter [Ureibacillus chungkukjangi]PYF05194.1 DHA1 family multidrug resistance protein-like MFS transporter [Ureibacillus chungkukjangi]